MGSYTAAVSGESFSNPDGSSRQREIERCRVGEAILLEREPDNRFDTNCIRVISARGVQIGNVAREGAEWMAARMDRGAGLHARIRSIGAGDAGTLGVVLDVKTDEDGWETAAAPPARGRPMQREIARPRPAPAQSSSGLGWVAIGAILLVLLYAVGNMAPAVPSAACTTARDGLQRAAAVRQMRFEPGQGRATIAVETWEAMGRKGQRDLTRLLAFDKACPDGEPEATKVAIVGAEGEYLWVGKYPWLN